MRVGDIVRCIRSGNEPNGRAIGLGQGDFGYGVRGESYRVVSLLEGDRLYLQSVNDNTHGRAAARRFEVVQEAPAPEPAPRPAPQQPAYRLDEQIVLWLVIWRNNQGNFSQHAYQSEATAQGKIERLRQSGNEILLRKKLTFDL